MVSTRPVEKREALDGALSEAVLHLKNDVGAAAETCATMRDIIRSSPDLATACALTKKLVATALSSWTPPTSDSDGFSAAAKLAGFNVATYGAGKNPGPAVVREPAYPVSTTAPLLKSVARVFSTEVLAPLHKHLAALLSAETDPIVRLSTHAFVEHLPSLVRAGSTEAPMTPKAPPTSRFTIDPVDPPASPPENA